MDLQKVKEALEHAQVILASQYYDTKYLNEAIAEIEKPVDEDAVEVARQINFDGAGVVDENTNSDWQQRSSIRIQQYAESYHAKQCEKCKREEVEARR